ncbi:adhesion G protein-coupled receptor A3-like [Clupea harengus]|uniref:Adhesion G protein-coupled receptor A3-like n=1 Tax=Clupea harengus TaxID=7950 RepID=A0A8M1KDG1_CLUHA|nr:adhesion G protein-coupled receptor A3-like [Clupea harengus]
MWPRPTASGRSCCTNRSAPSLRPSANQSAPSLRPSAKLTNLQVEAAQCRAAPLHAPPTTTATPNAGALLDNSLTEHSLDNDIKMHVLPLELQFRSVAPSNVAAQVSQAGRCRGRWWACLMGTRAPCRGTIRTSACAAGQPADGAAGVRLRRADQRGGGQRAERPPEAARGGGHQTTRASRRAAYMAYRERHMGQQDSSDASTSLPRRPRHAHAQPTLEARPKAQSYGLNLASATGGLLQQKDTGLLVLQGPVISLGPPTAPPPAPSELDSGNTRPRCSQ